MHAGEACAEHKSELGLGSVKEAWPAAVTGIHRDSSHLAGAAARDRDEKQKSPQNAYGFDLHAGTRAAAHDKKHRERLCRYLLRPPLSKERLARLPDGRYKIRLKSPWSDVRARVVPKPSSHTKAR